MAKGITKGIPMTDINNRIASIVNDNVFEAEKEYDAAYDCCSDEISTTCFSKLPTKEKVEIVLQTMSCKDMLKCLEMYYQNKHMKFSDYISPHIKRGLMKGLFLDDQSMIGQQFSYITQDFEDDMKEIIGKVFTNKIANMNVTYINEYWDELEDSNIINSECPRCNGNLEFKGSVYNPLAACKMCGASTYAQ